MAVSKINGQAKLDFLFVISIENKRRLQIKDNSLIGFNECSIPLQLPIRRRRKIKVLQKKISNITFESNRSKKEINNFKRLVFRNIRLQNEYQNNLVKIIANSATNIVIEIDSVNETSKELIKGLKNINPNLKISTEGLRG